MKKKRIAIITVPYITSRRHFDLATETLIHFKSSQYDIVNIGVINKLVSPYTGRILRHYDKVIWNDKNILARAWNKGIKEAMQGNYDYFLLPNLDVVSNKNTIDNLVEAALEFPDAVMWCSTEHINKGTLRKVRPEKNFSLTVEPHSFSYFMIDRQLFEKVGEFDEAYIPAYFEDWDMRDRIFASGNYIVRALHSLFYHYENATRKSDKRVAMQVIQNFRKNEKYYLKKRKTLLGY